MKTIFSILTIFVILVLSATGVFAQDTSTGEEASSSETICTILTEEARTVRVRVGPGENRTSVTFLPADVDIEVTGQTKDDNGNLWYQVDKETAAPERAINEAWVSATEVETSGSCDDIADTTAPPIIPIIAQPPPASASDLGADDTDSDSEEETTALGTMPNGGLWTVTWGPSVTVNCTDSGRETVAAVDFVGTGLTTEVIEFGYGQPIPFIFLGARLRNAGNDTYWGETYYTDDDGNTYRTTVYVDAVVTRHQMVGRFISSNDTCTATLTYVANYN